MSKFFLVVVVDRGRIYYKENAGGWTTHREGAKEFPTHDAAERERNQHWQWDTQHATRTESRRAKL